MKADKFKKKLRKIKRQGEQYKIEKQLRDAYAEYWPEHKKRKTSNIMLVIAITAIVAYTIASFWLQYNTGTTIDPTLTTLYYSFWTCEIFLLAGIRVSKVLKSSSSDGTCE